MANLPETLITQPFSLATSYLAYVTDQDSAATTIAAGSTSVLVRTPIVNDLLDENAETFTLTATNTD